MVAQAFQNWVADRGAQRRMRRTVDGFAAQWNCGATHRRFEQAMACLPEQSAEAVAEAIRTLFADDLWADSLIEGLADQMRADPFFDPPFPAINSDLHNGLIVYEDQRVSIAAGVAAATQIAVRKGAKRGATSVAFSGRVSVIKFAKAGRARIVLWEAPRITAGFSAATAGQCRPTGTRTLADGDILVIDGRYQSYVVEHAAANLVLLQAEINFDQAPLGVEYDSATRAYVGCSANGDAASRIQMITTLIRKLDRAGAFEAVAPLRDHPDFFVRWHVMKELLGIDAAAALPHLKRMAARDPHPEARLAARRVLDRLEIPKSRKAA